MLHHLTFHLINQEWMVQLIKTELRSARGWCLHHLFMLLQRQANIEPSSPKPARQDTTQWAQWCTKRAPGSSTVDSGWEPSSSQLRPHHAGYKTTLGFQEETTCSLDRQDASSTKRSVSIQQKVRNHSIWAHTQQKNTIPYWIITSQFGRKQSNFK